MMLYQISFISIVLLLVQWFAAAPSTEAFSGISPQDPATTAATLKTEENPPPKLTYIRASKIIDQPISIPAPSPSNEDGKYCLDSYMQLPAAQYACVPMPLNASLTRLVGSADRFKLCVPPMNFRLPGVINLVVVPEVNARVKVQEDSVLISADECTIHGSPLIESLGLNERFDFSIRCCMTWGVLTKNDDNNNNNNNLNKNVEDSISATATTKDAEEEEEEEEQEFIRCNTTISLDFDPPGFFKRVPRQATEAVGNAAFSITMSRMLSQFMKGLAADFQKWCLEEDYRKARKQMELDVLEEEEEEEVLLPEDVIRIENQMSTSSTAEETSNKAV
mmetsp:Transcript_4401/g.6486  ORF Transcript_4401/g.6486 Transcript_4401/m.6486 type:complete len:335 (-) Transcript_4401:1423-2427(-)